MYFLKWVESENGGKGGKDWVAKHVKAFMSVGGKLFFFFIIFFYYFFFFVFFFYCILGVFMGVPKSFGAMMSGETKGNQNKI